MGFAGIAGLAASDTFSACYNDAICRNEWDAYCYSVGWFDSKCGDWRAYNGPLVAITHIPNPTIPQPPTVDTSGGSTPSNPTYGQATVTLPDGTTVVVNTPEEAQILINQQIAAKAVADRAQIQDAFNKQAAGACAVKAQDCGPFTSVNADCTDCVFDPGKPLFIVLAIALAGLLMAMKK